MSEPAEAKGRTSGLWCYRVSNDRIICQIEDHHLAVVVIKIGHRREIYR